MFPGRHEQFPKAQTIEQAKILMGTVITLSDIKDAFKCLYASTSFISKGEHSRWLQDNTIDLFLLRCLHDSWQSFETGSGIMFLTTKAISVLIELSDSGKLSHALKLGMFSMLFPFKNGNVPEKVLFPLLINGNHWVLGLIFKTNGQYVYAQFNSLLPSASAALSKGAKVDYRVQLVLNFLKLRFPLHFNHQTKILTARKEDCVNLLNPQQLNGEDCGVYVCIHGMRLIRNMQHTSYINSAVGRAVIAIKICDWSPSMAYPLLPRQDPLNLQWHTTLSTYDLCKEQDYILSLLSVRDEESQLDFELDTSIILPNEGNILFTYVFVFNVY